MKEAILLLGVAAVGGVVIYFVARKPKTTFVGAPPTPAKAPLSSTGGAFGEYSGIVSSGLQFGTQLYQAFS